MKTTHTIADLKLKMMKSSTRCLVFGFLSFIPMIGVAFGLLGLWHSYAARRHESYFWNPAKLQRVLGLVCAAFGTLIWGAMDTIIVYHAFNNYGN